MKNLLRYLALTLTLIVGFAIAQTQKPECVKTTLSLAQILPGYVELNNCTNNQGTMTYPSGEQYAGQWKNGKRNGFGTIYYPNGKTKFAGEFKNDEINGIGTEYSLIGSIIAEGTWVDGKFVSPSQSQQNSDTNTELTSNLPACQGFDVYRWNNCFGTSTYASGDRYIGEWKNGAFNGQGTYYFQADNERKGDKYVGEFKDGKRDGQGSYYVLANNKFKGTKYIGGFKENLLHGVGTFTTNNGESYLGEYKLGERDGRGTLTFVNGEKYVGEFKRNNYNGQGTYYSSNGAIANQGMWTDGNFVESELAKPTQQLSSQQASPSNISPRNSKRIALVIGNASYNSAPLKNPLNDAADISAALRQSGFEVIDQRNATLQEMTRGIREFGDKLLKSDVGLVYYSGHGLEVKGRNYLLPVNASMIREDEIAFQAVDANLILEKMNTAKKSVNILIVDACRDNPFARSFRSVNRGLAQMDAPTGTIVSFSTAPGKTASDGDGRNSPFTKNLVKAMMRADMPIEAMFKEVRKSVVEETKGQQTPWESSSLIGDFYFKVSK